jgi:hypothetical protein
MDSPAPLYMSHSDLTHVGLGYVVPPPGSNSVSLPHPGREGEAGREGLPPIGFSSFTSSSINNATLSSSIPCWSSQARLLLPRMLGDTARGLGGCSGELLPSICLWVLSCGGFAWYFSCWRGIVPRGAKTPAQTTTGLLIIVALWYWGSIIPFIPRTPMKARALELKSELALFSLSLVNFPEVLISLFLKTGLKS